MPTLRRSISGLTGAGSFLLIIAWAASRLITDRWRWSQYPWWIPTWAWMGAALVLLLLSPILAEPGERIFGRSAGARLRRLGLCGIIVMVASYGLIECRIYRLLWREPQDHAVARRGGLRILFWNPSSTQGLDMTALLNVVGSDLAVVANPAWDSSFSPAAEKYGWPWYISDGLFVVFSRCPVRRWGSGTLGLGNPDYSRGDPGRGMWLEIDTSEPLGRPMIVWILDLPSSGRRARYETASRAAQALAAWPGPALIPDGRGGVVGQEERKGFPAPDLVLGDFNAPRGSASLSVLAPRTTGAYEQAGAGYVATFPRPFPVLHIDQILTGPHLKATDYRVIDPQKTRHLMQWARIEAR